MFFQSQRSALTAAFLAVALIPVCVLVGWQSWAVRTEIARTHERQNAAAQRLAREIAAFVEMHRRGIEAAAHQVTQSRRRGRVDFDAILSALHQQFPGFINLYFADTGARTLSFYPEFNDRGESMVGVDFSNRWHYKALKKELKTYISPVMKGVGGTEKLLCTIVAPFYDARSAFDGFVLGALNLEKIGEIIRQAALPEGTYAVVTDAIGQVIASPDWSADRMPEQLDLPEIPASMDPGTAVMLRHDFGPAGTAVLSSVVATSDPDWHVWLSVPASRDEQLMRGWLLLSGFLIAAVFLSVILAATALSGRLSRAIERLEDKARLLEAHRYGEAARVSVPARAPTEVKTLEATLDAMSVSLLKARDELVAANAALERRVRERTAVLSLSLESMQEGFGLMDTSGVFTIVNPVLGAFAAVQPPETLTRERLIAMVAGMGNLPAHQVAAALSENATRLTVVAGQDRIWELRSFEVTDGERYFGRGVILSDISQRYRLDAMKNALISVAAHEFKTPLAAIRMQSETLAREDVVWDEETRRELVGGLLDDVKRLESLMRDWLDVSRIEAGAVVLHRSRADLAAVIDAARRAVDPELVLDVAIAPDARRVVLDAKAVGQVLVNLLTNALRYCDRKPHVRIRAKMENGMLSVSVTDNGIGIAQQHLEAIFEKFHQVDMSATRRSGGTGLGLTISRGLVRAHGGDLTVRSRPGEGSTFTFKIPQEAV